MIKKSTLDEYEMVLKKKTINQHKQMTQFN